MTIHITDIPNESFNHYKHVLHVDNEFALIEINKNIYFKPFADGQLPNTVVLVDVESKSDVFLRITGLAVYFFKFLVDKKTDDPSELQHFLREQEFEEVELSILARDYADFLSNLRKLRIICN